MFILLFLDNKESSEIGGNAGYDEGGEPLEVHRVHVLIKILGREDRQILLYLGLA